MFHEITKAWTKLRGRVPGELRQQGLTVKGGGRIIGFRAGSLSDWTGFHDPLGVLCVLSEAQGLPGIAYEGAYASVVSSKDRLLACGNPHTPDLGPFHQASESPLWTRFQLSCLDHQNITGNGPHIAGAVEQDFVDMIAGTYGIDSPEWMAKIEGKFPRESEFGLLARPPLEAAVQRSRDTDPDPTAPLVAGLDVGRDRDPSVLAVLRGNHVLPIIEFPPDHDLTVTLGKVEAVLYEHQFRPRGAGLTSHGRIVVDCSGLGAPLYDMMKARGWNVDQFLGGSTAWDPDRYDNTRAEAMFTLKRRIEAGTAEQDTPQKGGKKDTRRERLRAVVGEPLAIPDDDMLLEECQAIRWYTTPQGSRKRMERKEILRARIGRSIDRLDAVSMATWEPRGPRRVSVGGQVVTF